MLSIEHGPDAIRMTGRLDATEAASAQSALDTTAGRVTLDCSGLEYLSSAGLGVLLKTHKRLLAAQGGLRLTGVSRHLQDILSYSGFDQILEVEAAR
jgi:anti-sigma B factor antagonist